jgi:hypothetical protein
VTHHDKHSSLLRCGIDYDRKKFCSTGRGEMTTGTKSENVKNEMMDKDKKNERKW